MTGQTAADLQESKPLHAETAGKLPQPAVPHFGAAMLQGT